MIKKIVEGINEADGKKFRAETHKHIKNLEAMDMFLRKQDAWG